MSPVSGSMNNEPMRKLAHLILIVATSALMLSILHYLDRFLPHRWSEQSYFLGDLIIALLALGLIKFFLPRRLVMLRLPKFDLKLLLCLFVGLFIFSLNYGGFPLHLVSWRRSIWGIICLLGIGFAEELFSRGFVFNMLRKFGDWRAVWISSAAFGAMHIPYVHIAKANLMNTFINVSNATAWGVVICGIYLITNSIWPCIIFHAFNDSMMFFEVKQSLPTPPTPGSIWPRLWWDFGSTLFFILIGAGLVYYGLWCEKRRVRTNQIDPLVEDTFTYLPVPLKIQ